MEGSKLVVAVVEHRELVRESLVRVLDGNVRLVVLHASSDRGLGDVVPDVLIVARRFAARLRRPGAIVLEVADDDDLPHAPTHFRLADLSAAQSLQDWSDLTALYEESRPPRFTPRQMEVLRHVQVGESAKDIAAALGISVKTVENHKSALYAKLGVQSQSEVAALRSPSGGDHSEHGR